MKPSVEPRSSGAGKSADYGVMFTYIYIPQHRISPKKKARPIGRAFSIL